MTTHEDSHGAADDDAQHITFTMDDVHMFNGSTAGHINVQGPVDGVIKLLDFIFGMGDATDA